MSNYSITINGVTREVTLLKKDNTRVSFLLDGNRHEVEIATNIIPSSTTISTPQLAPASSPSLSASPASGEIVAPMPGVIVSVDVSEGDTVTAGQKLCVMEAMKMENNITATVSGSIEKICISPGEEVQNRQLLIKIS